MDAEVLARLEKAETSDERAAVLKDVVGETLHVVPSNHQLRALFTTVRDQATSREDFLFYSDRLMRKLMEEAINMLPAEEKTLETPTGETFTGLVVTKMCCAVSVIRSGECMEEALRTVWRDVKVGKLFIRTNHTSLTPQPVYINLPSDIKDRSVLLLEPMLATGVTSACALRILVSQGVPPSNIIHVSMLSTPAAIAFVHEAFPEVQLLTGEIDKGVDANSMIVPGLGNFGNRYFGTESE